MSSASPGAAPSASAFQTIPPAALPPRKRQLRNYLLDRGLQLRYIAVVLVISSIITGVLGFLIWNQANYASQKIVASLEQEDMKWLGEDMKSQVIASLQNSDSSLVQLMVIVGIGMTLILGFYVIIMTHKVAGPLYKIGQYFDEIRAGRLPANVYLRRGDQLQDLFQSFKDMNETLRKRAQDDAVAYGRFIDACEKAGTPSGGGFGKALDELRAVRQKKDESIVAG